MMFTHVLKKAEFVFIVAHDINRVDIVLIPLTCFLNFCNDVDLARSAAFVTAKILECCYC